MEKGQPWTIPGNQIRRYSAGPAMQLAPIHTIIHSTERHGVSVLSPASAVSEVPCSARCRLPTGCSQTGSYEQDLVDDHDTELSLVVPEVAKPSSGGCFDTSNWVFRIVWKHTHHMKTEELMRKFFYREDRGQYGEHHTSTRGVPSLGEFDEDAGPKIRGSDNHRHQERGRRVRHRCFQAESDKCIGDFPLNIAQQEMSKIKEYIREAHEKQKASMLAGSAGKDRRHSEKASATSSSAKKLGKDDQLAAALMSQYMGFILIARLQQDLTQARDDIEAANERVNHLANELREVKEEQTVFQEPGIYMQDSIQAEHWRHRFETSEAERQVLEDEVSSLRRQLRQNSHSRGSITPYMHCSLPSPLVSVHEGTPRTEAHGPLLTPVLIQDESEMHQRKRKRFTLEPPTISIKVNGQHRLPLSPAPSYDGSPSPSLYQG